MSNPEWNYQGYLSKTIQNLDLVLVVCDPEQFTKRQHIRSSSLYLFNGKMIKSKLQQLQVLSNKIQVQRITKKKNIILRYKFFKNNNF